MNKLIRRSTIGTLSLAILAAGALSLPIGASAKDGDIIRRGDCTGATDWKLKLSPEDGRIERDSAGGA